MFWSVLRGYKGHRESRDNWLTKVHLEGWIESRGNWLTKVHLEGWIESRGNWLTKVHLEGWLLNRTGVCVCVLTCVVVMEVGKKTARDRLMTDYKNVLLSFQFHNHWFQTVDDVHVWLSTTAAHMSRKSELNPFLSFISQQLRTFNSITYRHHCIHQPVLPRSPSSNL